MPFSHRGGDALAFQRKGYALCADRSSFQSNFNGLGGKVGDDRGHLQRRCAISEQSKVLCRDDVQGHIPVNAAVCHIVDHITKRWNIQILPAVYFHCNG